MPKTSDQISNLDAELDALSSPSTADTYAVTKDYDPDVVAASAAKRALGSGVGGGAQLLKVATQHVTASEITGIGNGATPVEIVAAPDAETVLVPTLTVFDFHFGTVAWDYDPGLIVTWEEYVGQWVANAPGVLSGTNNSTFVAPPMGEFVFNPTDSGIGSPLGQALVLSCINIGPDQFAEPFGDGTMDVTVYYIEVAVA